MFFNEKLFFFLMKEKKNHILEWMNVWKCKQLSFHKKLHIGL
nr:MAG TPA: hypothetical protein [Caudoviricetes sp.]